jgi:TonB-dependent SusC/RagA subfamily outer membrane receptor
VPGVNIEITSGRPGAQPSVLLRGVQSINGEGRGQEPLYIIDGVEMSSLADINPQDIESVEVVKGAAAASLYGSRAGAGVIQVTTRSGRNGAERVRFDVRMEYGLSDIEGEYKYSRANFLTMNETRTGFCLDATNCTVGVDLAAETRRTNSVDGPYSDSPVRIDGDGGINRSVPAVRLRGMFAANRWPVSYDPVASTTTLGQHLNSVVSATGRVGKTNFFASANGFAQEGSIRYQPGYDRKSIRLNLDQQIRDGWTFAFRTYFSTSESNGASQENSGTGFVRLTRQPAYVNLLAKDDQDRLYIRSSVLVAGATYANPLTEFQETTDRDTQSQFLSSFTTTIWPTSWFEMDGNLNFSRNNSGNLFRQDVGYRTLTASASNLGQIRTSSASSPSLNTSVNASARHAFMGRLDSRLTGRVLVEDQSSGSLRASGKDLAALALHRSTR